MTSGKLLFREVLMNAHLFSLVRYEAFEKIEAR